MYCWDCTAFSLARRPTFHSRRTNVQTEPGGGWTGISDTALAARATFVLAKTLPHAPTVQYLHSPITDRVSRDGTDRGNTLTPRSEPGVARSPPRTPDAAVAATAAGGSSLLRPRGGQATTRLGSSERGDRGASHVYSAPAVFCSL